ncbi:21091_t:CDS:2 [Gigaspora margarita]|uniref:21091_t:CDS:1 n=1 Tax=Gigaspora margarita TaxID=4874 RepID=A0ABN7VRQ0_GIGMA|nr:21091_t:CDS:2 [Gigaspora margarita]
MAVIGLTASTIAARTYSVVIYEQVASRGKEEIIEVGNLLWNDEVARQNNGVKEVKFKKAKLRKKETPDN